MLKGVFAMVSSSALVQLIAILSVPILSRLYSPDATGNFATIIALVTIAAVVAPIRLDSAIQIAPDEELRTLVTASLASSFLVAILFLVFALATPVLSGVPTSVSTLTLACAIVLLSGAYNIFSAVVLRSRAYSEIASRNIYRQLGTTSGQLGAAHWLPDALGLMVGAACGMSFALASFFKSIRTLRQGPPPVRVVARPIGLVTKYWRFPVLLAPAALLSALAVQVPQLFISIHYSLTDAGNLAQALRVGAAPVVLIGTAVAGVLIGEMSTKVRAGDFYARADFLHVSRRLGAMALAWFLLLTIVAPAVLPLGLGPGWDDSGRYARAIAPLAATYLVAAPLSIVLVLYQRAWLALGLDLLKIAASWCAGLLAVSAGFGPVASCTLVASGAAAVYVLTWLACFRTVSTMDGSGLSGMHFEED